MTFAEGAAIALSVVQAVTTVVLAVLTGRYIRLTANIAEMSKVQAKAATDAARAARLQNASSLLELYSPVVSAVGATIGQLTALRLLNPVTDSPLVRPEFESAVETSRRIEPSLAASMSSALTLLRQAELRRATLLTHMSSTKPDHAIREYLETTLKTMLEMAEAVLGAIHAELSPELERLMNDVGRKRVTLASLKERLPSFGSDESA